MVKEYHKIQNRKDLPYIVYLLEDKKTKTIDWSTLNPKSSYEIRQCFAKKCNVQIRVCPETWKKDLPQLCALLHLKHQASISDVLSVLKSSSAFPVKAIAAAGFVPSDNIGKTEVLWAKEDLETGSVRVKIRIPMQYEQLASKKSVPESNRRKDFEKFVKKELSVALNVPESLLNPEVDIAEIQKGSVLVVVILSASALSLIYVGLKLPQTPTFQAKKFELLMAMGGLAAGSALGVVAGGPVGAAIGGLTGLTATMVTAWFVGRDVRDAGTRATAWLSFIGSAISLIISFHQVTGQLWLKGGV